MTASPVGTTKKRTRAPGIVLFSLLVMLAAACDGTESTTGDPLAATNWEMTSVWSGGIMKPASPTTISTLVFADGTADGSTGCNLFRSAYSIEGNSIAFGDPAVTGSACHPDYVDQGDAVIQALQASKRFTLSENQLELTDATGTVQMQFRPATLLPLVGITWRLAWYGDGTSPLDGTEISLALNTEGTLAGIAGCNHYSADYLVNGDQLMIGAVALAETTYLESDEVMSQETDYLNTINKSASFTTTLTGLELLDSEGDPLAEYRFGGRTRKAASGSA